MRVSNWNPQKYDGEFAKASMERLRNAARVIAKEAARNCPVGTLSRPMYKKGKYAGQPWTARDAGALLKSIRVVEKKEDYATLVTYGGPLRNVRVYAGNYLVYYAAIVEFHKSYLRKALNASKGQVRSILENGV